MQFKFMKSFKLLFALLLSANIFASTYLESSYNSIDFDYATSFGDVDASASSGTITFNLKELISYLGSLIPAQTSMKLLA